MAIGAFLRLTRRDIDQATRLQEWLETAMLTALSDRSGRADSAPL